jgi:hypothetical protein
MELNSSRRTEEYRNAAKRYRNASHVAARQNQAGASDYHLPHGERGTGRLGEEPDAGQTDFDLIPYADAVARDPTLAEFDSAPIEDTQPSPELMSADERPFFGLFVIPMIPLPGQTAPSRPGELECVEPPCKELSLSDQMAHDRLDELPVERTAPMPPFIPVEKEPTDQELIPYADAVARDPTLAEFDSASIEDTQANPDWVPPPDQPFLGVFVLPTEALPGQTDLPQPGELGYVGPPSEELSFADQMARGKLDEPRVEWTVPKLCCIPVEEEPTDEELHQEELEEEAHGPLDQHEREVTPECHTDSENVLVIEFPGD